MPDDPLPLEQHGSCPDFLKPSLRIFLSVDIVGSTNFKQLIASKNSDEGKQPGLDITHPGKKWLDPILQFYDQMAARFSHNWGNLSQAAEKELHWSIGEVPRLWKAVGDELIFSKILRSHQEAYICVAAMLRSVQGFREIIKEHNPGLDLKCAAWVAGFPINNAEVVLAASTDTDSKNYEDDGDPIFANLTRLHALRNDFSAVRDYIGPSIDTGFRVASLASPRRFVLTVDLALLLSAVSSATPATAESISPFVYYYLGRQALKGVTNGVPYPVFWIDAVSSSPLTKLEDRLEGLTSVDASLVKEYCEHYIDGREGTHIIRPYMLEDPDHLFKYMPQDHKTKLDALTNYWVLESKKREIEKQAANASSSEDETLSLGHLDRDSIENISKIFTALQRIQDPDGPVVSALARFLTARNSLDHEAKRNERPAQDDVDSGGMNAKHGGKSKVSRKKGAAQNIEQEPSEVVTGKSVTAQVKNKRKSPATETAGAAEIGKKSKALGRARSEKSVNLKSEDGHTKSRVVARKPKKDQ